MALLPKVFGANDEYMKHSRSRNSKTTGHRVRNMKTSTPTLVIPFSSHQDLRQAAAPEEMVNLTKIG